MKNMGNQEGLIKFILIFIILVIILSVLKVDLRAIIESELVQRNFAYIWSIAKMIWNDYLADPVTYFWNNIFISLLWTSFIENMERIKAGQPSDLMLQAPKVDFLTLPQ